MINYFNVLQLSNEFMTDYPSNRYPELMTKQGRPYTCLLIDTCQNYLICIPFRSSIGHKNAFFFTGTQRSRQSHSGLDYSKVVLIKKKEYIDTVSVVVDQDEYNEARANLPDIEKEIVEYIETYVNHINGSISIHRREYERKYKFSTLPYFHDVLGLDSI